jgi:molybdenum cofactor synthesis domain-containing protein
MNKNIQVNAAIIIIGNEILSGRTQDVNSSTIALWLNSLGVKVQEVRVIPDVEGVIVKTINVVRKKNNYVFTTGGIGPTHDDITAKSISKAFNVKYEVNKKAYKILENYYKQGEFNEGRQKMAWTPSQAKLISNPTSGAPGFIIGNVYCLPGVPSILKSMLGGLNNLISGGKPIISHTINLRTVESEIAKSLTLVQDSNKDVEIGSYPFFKAGKLGVNIVIRSDEQSKIDICTSQILEFVNKKNIKIINRG